MSSQGAAAAAPAAGEASSASAPSSAAAPSPAAALAPAPAPTSAPAPPPPGGLSAKEAKAAAKAAKAQRRAAAKGVPVGQAAGGAPAGQGQGQGQSHAAKGQQGQHGRGKQSATAGGTGGAGAAAAGGGGPAGSPAGSTAGGGGVPALPTTAATVASGTTSLLSGQAVRGGASSSSSSTSSSSSSSPSSHTLISTVHPPPSSAATRASLLTSSLSRGLHPSVVLLMQHLASHTLLGSSARAIATLAALRDFISDYKTPRGAVLNRDMVAKLGQQISGITSARPLGSSAGNAVRYLKYEISVVPAEMGEAAAKAHLVHRIDHFIRDRIIFAARVISTHVTGKIRDRGDVIVTYARSSVAEQALLEAWDRGKRFEVICVGGETFSEGKRLLASLLGRGIPASYAPLTALSTALAQPRVSLVLLGTAALMSNGALYARAGTATVAMMASHRKIPVIVCCETYKFSERVRLEGVGGNEQADAGWLLPGSDGGAGAAKGGDNAKAGAGAPAGGESSPSPNLSGLNLLYDLTPSRYITAIASEVGLSGPESVAIVLRDYKSILFGS